MLVPNKFLEELGKRPDEEIDVLMSFEKARNHLYYLTQTLTIL